MCGIAGIYNYKTKVSVDKGILNKMNESMIHRGPDGGDIWVSTKSSIGLAHRRLSIVDLSNSASQPMCNETGCIWITFNGEVYNHLLLRKELIRKGHIFKTNHSDTEVLIHGYEEWGIEELLNKVEGDYAFVIWDENIKKLFLSRDRVGVKPLYFSFQKDGFLFASEIKSILKHPQVIKEVDYLSMYHYLSFLTTPAPLTMFKGIFKLPAGFYLVLDENGKIESKRYWEAAPGKFPKAEQINKFNSEIDKEEYYVKEITRRLKAGVNKRMMSDVPIGVFLSGGIDSSLNVALMSECTDKPLETFTVGFKDYSHLNELNYAKEISEKFKTNHHEILIDENDMIDYLNDLTYQQDEPLADWVCIPLYFVSKLAKDKGITVVQVGEGSDEQFAGYRQYMSYLKMEKYFWIPFRKFIPKPLAKIFSKIFTKITKYQSNLHFYSDIIYRASYDKELFWTGATSFWNTSKKYLLHESTFKNYKFSKEIFDTNLLPTSYQKLDSFNIINSFLSRFDSIYKKQDSLTRMIYNEFQLRLPELLLMRVDKITMSLSLEARVPFLDHNLIDFTMSIPQEFKVKNGDSKHLLKKAAEGIIPNSIIYRKKMGFNAPMNEWLKGPFGQKVKDRVLKSQLIDDKHFNLKYIHSLFEDHFNNKQDNSLYIWTLFNLTEWHNCWITDVN